MSKQTGILRPLGLALVLAIGFGAVFALVASWGISIWQSLHQNRVFENLVVRADGTPLIQRYTYDGYQNTVTYHALEDGREVPGPKKNTDENWLSGASLPVPVRDWVTFPLEGSARVRRFADGQTPPVFWYFLDDGARDGRGYFVGYDSKSKLCVGFIGRNGLRPDQPPVEQWFPMDGAKLASARVFSRFTGPYWYGYYSNGESSEEFPSWKVDMISGAQLLEVDLRSGSVTTVMESPDLVSVGILETVSASKADGEEPPRVHRHAHLAVRTTDRVLVFDARGKQRAAYPLPEELRDRSITLYEVDEGTLLATRTRLLPDRSRRYEELRWIDASGKVVRQAEASLGEGSGRNDAVQAWQLAVAIPVPVIHAVAAIVAVPLADWAIGLEPNYSAALARSLAAWWPALLVVSLLGAVLAWYCCRRHRRYYQHCSGVWFVFVLLTGLPGLVAYLFHRRWPVLEKCPACGQAVPHDREACANCGAAFPPPEPKGCEVFA